MISFTRQTHLRGGLDVPTLALLCEQHVLLRQTCFSFQPYLHGAKSKAILKIKKDRKKNTMFCSIGSVSKVLETQWMRDPSLFSLEMTLSRQNGISHRNIDINPLGRGHTLKEV